MNEHLSQAISLKLHDAGIVVESASGYIQANKAVKPHVVERVKCPFEGGCTCTNGKITLMERWEGEVS